MKKHKIPDDWLPRKVVPETSADTDSDEKKEAQGDGEAAAGEEREAAAHNEHDDVDEDDDAGAAAPEEDIDFGSADHDVADVEADEEDPNAEMIPPIYVRARELFFQADVCPADDIDLKWSEPDEKGLKEFLVDRMGFNPERVESGIAKLKEAHKKKAQKRMDSFFTTVPTAPNADALKKRKPEPAKGKGAAPSKFARKK